MLLVSLTIPIDTRGEYYKYIDKDGIVHFTDSMPDVLLEQRKSMSVEKVEQKSPPSNEEIKSAMAESTDNCGGELEDTIKSCKRILQNEAAFQASVKSLNSFDISSMYKVCNLSLVRNKLTRQEKELLDNMESQIELMRRNLTQNELNMIEYGTGMQIARCEAKRTYSQKEIDELDVILRGIWEDMNTALAQSDIQKAVSYYVERYQELWKKQFSAFMPEMRKKIAQDNLSAHLNAVEIKGNRAIYELITTRNGQAYSFQLTFEKNSQGKWKINSY